MKNLAILGSTGSIGRNTLSIAAMFPERFSVKVLAAKNNVTLLAEQIERFAPDIAVVFDADHAKQLNKHLAASTKTEILWGEAAYQQAAAYESVDTVVSAIVGAAGLQPTLAAIAAQKTVALANKETLVMAGDIVMRAAKDNQIRILPIDSEHSAIFQCLQGSRRQDLTKIILTASGGPFLDKPIKEFETITVAKALKHPNWQMGPKITIDSATLMNKGLEVIEAMHLFGVAHDLIDVVIHPQSIVHSMVAYQDGSVMAQLGMPDMKGAIAYALAFPQRLALNLPGPDFADIGSLTFKKPAMDRCPCLALAYRACEAGGTLPAVLNAANEVAVAAFLDRQLSFIAIAQIIERTMAKHATVVEPLLNDILQADQWARETAAELAANSR